MRDWHGKCVSIRKGGGNAETAGRHGGKPDREETTVLDDPTGTHGKRFTLIELLVVISIMAILMALLLPVLSRAKVAAVKVSCLNRLKQFVVAAHSYADDYEGRFPARNSKGGYPHQLKRTPNYKYNLHPTYIRPYVDTSPQMVFCPGQNMNHVTNPPDAAGDVQWSSYTFFIWPNGMYWQVPQPNMARPIDVRNPELAAIWSCKLQIRYGVPKPNHTYSGGLDGQNAAMADGSAAWFEWAQTEMVWRYNNDAYYWPIYRE